MESPGLGLVPGKVPVAEPAVVARPGEESVCAELLLFSPQIQASQPSL